MMDLGLILEATTWAAKLGQTTEKEKQKLRNAAKALLQQVETKLHHKTYDAYLSRIYSSNRTDTLQKITTELNALAKVNTSTTSWLNTSRK